MGLIGQLVQMLFGGGRNVVVETAQMFAQNAEKAGQRQAIQHADVIAQFAAEFAPRHKGGFDRFMDGVNRIPRPAMALGTLALIGAALSDPVWFSSRMQGLALVPEPLWWLLGAIVSFYFGARAQTKGQEFQSALADTLARVPQVVSNIEKIQSIEVKTPAPPGAPNPALAAWQEAQDTGQGTGAKKK